MSHSWEEFRKSTTSRFLVPIRLYTFSLNFVTFQPHPEQKKALAQLVLGSLVDLLKRTNEPLQHLKLLDGVSDGVLFRVAQSAGPNDFQVQFNESSIIFQKFNSSIEDLFLTMESMFSPLADQLFSPSSKFYLGAFDFFNNSYSTAHKFESDLLLGHRLSDEDVQVDNRDIMRNFFVSQQSDSVLSWLQPDDLIRTNIDLSTLKMVGGREGNIWITAKAPWSKSYRELILETSIRRGEAPQRSALAVEDLNEFHSVLENFYRDIILDRVFKNIFNDTSISINPKR